jgi:hypothetical protein
LYLVPGVKNRAAKKKAGHGASLCIWWVVMDSNHRPIG